MMQGRDQPVVGSNVTSDTITVCIALHEPAHHGGSEKCHVAATVINNSVLLSLRQAEYGVTAYKLIAAALQGATSALSVSPENFTSAAGAAEGGQKLL